MGTEVLRYFTYIKVAIPQFRNMILLHVKANIQLLILDYNY